MNGVKGSKVGGNEKRLEVCAKREEFSTQFWLSWAALKMDLLLILVQQRSSAPRTTWEQFLFGSHGMSERRSGGSSRDSTWCPHLHGL